MSVMTDLRKSVSTSTPVYAVVGVTDLAVQKVREMQDRATKARAVLEQRGVQLRAEFGVKQLPATVQSKAQEAQVRAQHLPTEALTKVLEAAGRAEETYEDLGTRGKKLIDRIAGQAATKDLLNQGKLTISRGKAVVTTARRGSKDTQTAAKAAVTTARRETAEVVGDTQKTVATRTTGTKRAVKRTTTTATKRAVRTKRVARATTTGARKTAQAASRSTQAGAAKVGS
jgi:heparin binding hemagglutinin HbhA